MSDMFYFAERVVLEQAEWGKSGAAALRAFCSDQDGQWEGSWFVKLSNSPSRLLREANGHVTMTRTSLPFGRIAPLLWPGVVVTAGTAGIAYQFVGAGRTAAALLAVNASDTLRRVASLVSECFKRRRDERSVLSTVLCERLSRERATVAIQRIGDCVVKSWLGGVANGKIGARGAESVVLQHGDTHGDLHLKNVLVDDAGSVMIDFATSRRGPIVADASKLMASVLLSAPQYRVDRTLDFEGFGSPPELRVLRDSFVLKGDDLAVFGVFLKMYLGVALSYDDDSVDADTKTWIASRLEQETEV